FLQRSLRFAERHGVGLVAALHAIDDGLRACHLGLHLARALGEVGVPLALGLAIDHDVERIGGGRRRGGDRRSARRQRRRRWRRRRWWRGDGGGGRLRRRRRLLRDRLGRRRRRPPRRVHLDQVEDAGGA